MCYDTNKPALVYSAVSFVDILGFSNMSSEEYNDELLLNLNNAMSNNVSRVDLSRISGITKVFTDNIVVGCPLPISAEGIGDCNESSKIIFQLIDRLGVYQLNLALCGFFVRGGLTLGSHYMNEVLVFGPALIEAYKIESQVARDPRIILSNSTIELVKYRLKNSTRPQFYESVLLVDYDGQWFINYLEYAYDELNMAVFLDEFDFRFRNMIDKHKRVVEQNLQRYKDNPKILSKFLWIANYHNYFCKTHDKYLEGLQIENPLTFMNPSKVTL